MSTLREQVEAQQEQAEDDYRHTQDCTGCITCEPGRGTTIYVAGPMSGLPDFNYPAFNAASYDLTTLGYSVLNPVDNEQHNDTPKPQAYQWYLRHAVRLLTYADAIALLPGWEDSTGANLERVVGEALDLDIRTLAEWLP